MKKIFTLLFLALPFSANVVMGQCKTVEKKCLDGLRPYKFGGQGNYKVVEGKSMELVATFYGGEQYRIYFCPPPDWPKAQFNVYDQNRKLIYTNRIDDTVTFWDFKPKKTQNYIIEGIVPFRNDNSAQTKKGCFSILIGFK